MSAQLARVLELLDDDDEAALTDEEALGVDVPKLAARIRAMVAAADEINVAAR